MTIDYNVNGSNCIHYLIYITDKNVLQLIHMALNIYILELYTFILF
jgi:hypothetical protein